MDSTPSDDDIRRTAAGDEFDAILAQAVAKVMAIPIEVCRDRCIARRCWTCLGIADEREFGSAAGPVVMWAAEHEEGCKADLAPPAPPVWN